MSAGAAAAAAYRIPVVTLLDGQATTFDMRGIPKLVLIPGAIVRAHGTLAISGAAAETFKTTTTSIVVIDGVEYSKVATDGLLFSDDYTINVGTALGDYWGAFLVQQGDDGAITTKAVAADQVYATEAAAIAALPAADAGTRAIGDITVEANTDSAWTANTDDLTAASDCQDANFYDVGCTVSYSIVDSPNATAHLGTPTTAATLLTAVSVATAWPFYRVSAAGLAGCRVARIA